jgi:hypothetical protein
VDGVSAPSYHLSVWSRSAVLSTAPNRDHANGDGNRAEKTLKRALGATIHGCVDGRTGHDRDFEYYRAAALHIRTENRDLRLTRSGARDSNPEPVEV